MKACSCIIHYRNTHAAKYNYNSIPWRILSSLYIYMYIHVIKSVLTVCSVIYIYHSTNVSDYIVQWGQKSRLLHVHVLMRDEKEGRKKQARSNKQQGKATQHTQGSHFS